MGIKCVNNGPQHNVKISVDSGESLLTDVWDSPCLTLRSPTVIVFSHQLIQAQTHYMLKITEFEIAHCPWTIYMVPIGLGGKLTVSITPHCFLNDANYERLKPIISLQLRLMSTHNDNH